VTFSVGGTTILVDRSTDFKKSNCDDLRNGRDVEGAGTMQTNGSVKASEIRVRKD
jgi:hypothetical protein